jgi:hypothetical protein
MSGSRCSDEHAEGHGDRMFEAVCKLGLEGIVSKKFDAPYKSGTIKEVAENQKSEGTGCHARYRGGLLI